MTQNVYSNANPAQSSDNTRIPFDEPSTQLPAEQPQGVVATLFDILKHSDFPEPATGDATARNPRRYRDQARRLIDTRALDRNTWLAIRRSGIGSSDAAALGLNPYKSQLELWLEKTGRQAQTTEPEGEDKLTSPLHWGQILEPIVADHYAQHTGHRVQRVNAILQHVDHPWMLANLDREIVGNDEVQMLELDLSFNTTLGPLHEDYEDRVIRLKTQSDIPNVEVYVASPVDVAISKLGRFGDRDQQDIQALLLLPMVDVSEFERFAREAIGYYVGNKLPVIGNLEEALNDYRQANEQSS